MDFVNIQDGGGLVSLFFLSFNNSQNKHVVKNFTTNIIIGLLLQRFLSISKNQNILSFRKLIFLLIHKLLKLNLIARVGRMYLK